MSLAHFVAPGPLAAFGSVEQRLLTGLRTWAVAGRLGRWPVSALQDHLGCARAAAHLQLLIEEIGAAWPEPFCLSPLCCRRASHDEATLAAMTATAAGGDRAGFDRACGEMLPADARERLFLSLGLVASAIAAAPAVAPARRRVQPG